MRQLTRLKKMLAGILAAAMVFTTGVTVASAATTSTDTTTGTLTINNAVSDNNVSYDVYRIFDFEGSTVSSDNSFSEGVYKLSENWSGFTSTYFTVGDSGVLSFNDFSDETAAKALAKAALAFAKENGISPDYTRTDAAETLNDDGATSTLVFSNISLGYYLVDSSVGTLLALDTLTPDATISEKNEVPTIEKIVYDEDRSDAEGKTNDSGVGKVVTFKVTVHAKAGAQNYVIHEKMSEGLNFTDITSIILKDSDGNERDLTAQVKAVLDTAPTDGDTFDIVAPQSCLDLLTEDMEDMDIIITYTATVNEKAVTYDKETNDVYLEYGEGNKTTEEHTDTYVYKFNLHKYSASDSTSANLAGATFSLLSDNKVEIGLVNTAENNYRVATSDDAEADIVTEFTTTATGDIVISGLDAGKYYLRETAAPSGYNRTTDDIEVQITRKNTDAADGEYLVNSREDHTVYVANGTGAVLPSTGGIGTTIFYIIGGILIIAALAAFIVKRKSSDE